MSRLHIGNLLPSTSSATLTSALQSDGRTFARIQLVPSRDAGRSRGFAFVELAQGDDLATVITALQGREVDGQRITVAEAHGPKSRFGIASGKPTPIRPLR